MKKTTSTSALRIALFAAAGAAACAWAPQAAADDHVPATDLGTQADVGGGQQWTVMGLQPSADQIGATPAGSLWEATATATPLGGGIPVVPGFAARTADGQDYPVMWSVPTPLGINPSPLPAGESATGKLYFDVTGTAPNSVTYTRDGQDAAVWVQPPPASSSAPATYGSGVGASTYAPPMQSAPAPVTAPRAATPAPAPAASGSSGTPAPAAAGTTPAPATGGSSGTPQPTTGSVGTPATPGSTTATPAAPTTPAPASAAATAPTPQASTSPAAGNAPAGGTPAPAAAPTTPPPASAPLPGTGSSGTPFTVPMTTPVPVPAG